MKVVLERLRTSVREFLALRPNLGANAMALTPGAKNPCILYIDVGCHLEERHKFGRKRQRPSNATKDSLRAPSQKKNLSKLELPLDWIN